ncbi:hypothetical protein [Streptococcus dentiloxodontae]
MLFNRKPKLTKEQQDNIVKRIIRGYDPITSVKFIEFSRDSKTCFYLLSLELNNDTGLVTTIDTENFEKFNDGTDVLGLNPINRFKSIERMRDLADDLEVDLSEVRITY